MFAKSVALELTDIYKSFSDFSRLRILHLLIQQPVCVCHFQEVIGLPQVNVSQHLAYLRKAGLVEFRRVQTWKIYQIVSPCPPELEVNLKSLAECAKFDPIFKRDLVRLKEILKASRFSACVRIPATRRTRRLTQIHPL
ncbi:MAG TPA: metalloregulator ArsR/SmtB family transcription factor [Chthoniobacterales bacterium]|nr:metalloregulator ArsR/SmtB family transcription factor [Chthoniobacterales bacterium]